MSKTRKKPKNLGLIVGALALVLIFAVLLSKGDNQSAKIVIPNLEGEVSIFIDGVEEKTVSGVNKNLALKNITPGFHAVLIAKEGFWPWLKEVGLAEAETLVLEPFFVLQNGSGLIVTEEDPQYEKIRANFETIALPSFSDKKISESGRRAIWVEGGSLFTEWLGEEEERPPYFCNEFGCHNVMVPFGVGGDIRNVDFYKKRDDVFVIAFGTGVFALDADPTGNQNFQPIFEGENPQFISGDESSIYVLDNNLLLQVAL
ncbi:hypothetical protein COV42_02355 [Candidatus Campbellbacteria bacterium CG11_big_fil_rev_8_21_14_0_20_44_21]|uniref:PEGA domain-containing protein n=1 Tax=Candidatus Campbellbacteria bacterium CG22_combo_CG10-13_8_21_14_all_43_18 TaxID=1974530 RepID=A0A2H0DW18_9BACT|nr:MAG: hypothetical protein COW82_02330 [Candidatus Campbellbacteria bacterium CG22_combo_CG10-13_8_21_14_all_43_18]PIR24140.1 MAG: hypothetical protein COV42_02355 [Candidatus Campbellbacteria bacterium CG11_big_fil_rev_8_21_14_0_20_44_21]